MSKILCEKIVDYYINRIEDDKTFEKRAKNEERDVYRVMQAINNRETSFKIDGMIDLACLLNAAKQLTFDGERNIFEEFCATKQVEEITKDLEEKKPRETKYIMNYEAPEWSGRETKLEQEHEQVELYKTVISKEMYRAILQKVDTIIASRNKIPIKTLAKDESELSEINKSIIALSKISLRKKGFVPCSELKFVEEAVVIDYSDAEKKFGKSKIGEDVER